MMSHGPIPLQVALEFFHSLLVKPSHLLLNRVPLYNGEQFVTLQNGGLVFYPQYVFSNGELICSIQRLGYKLVDTWEDRIDCARIPFHSSRSLPYYYGLYFKQED